jgi:hypothetical protein
MGQRYVAGERCAIGLRGSQRLRLDGDDLAAVSWVNPWTWSSSSIRGPHALSRNVQD